MLFKELHMSKDKLTVTIHIGGKQVDKLSAEQCERIAQRLTETMSLYYTAHPEERKEIRNA
jgi:hypothetical protein